MRKKQGELLPRVAQLPITNEIGYYVAENASVTIYQSPRRAFGLYATLSFALGCALSVVLVSWRGEVHAANIALALLRNEPMLMPDSIYNNAANSPQVEESSKAPFSSVKTVAKQRRVEMHSPQVSKNKPSTLSITSTKRILERANQSVRNAILSASGKSFLQAESILLGEYQRGNSNQQLLSALGSLYSKRRQWKKAALSYSKACLGYTPNAVCFYNLGVSYDHLKKREKAVYAYEKALAYSSESQHGVDTMAIQRRVKALKKW